MAEGGNKMEPIIEINWSAIIQILLIIGFWITVGMIAVRTAVVCAKKDWGKD